MKLQTTDLDHESQYVLDCCCDDQVIDAGASVALRLYGDRGIIRDLVENTPVTVSRQTSMFGWRNQIAARLSAYADSLVEQMTVEQQGMIHGCALLFMRHVVVRGAEHLSYWAICDKVEGGCAENYHRPPKSRDGVTPYGKALRQLHAPAFIRRYVKREACSSWRQLANGVIRRCHNLPRSAIIADSSMFTNLLDEQRRRIAARHEIEWREIQAQRDEGRVIDFDIALKKSVVARVRKRERERNRVLKRAARTAVAVLGQDVVSAFARGQPVRLIGDHAAFDVRASGSLAKIGHGAIDLTLCDNKDTNKKLARLCFYIDKTPTLDQLTAIGLHAAAGEELDILKTANVTAVMRDGIGHPLLASRMPETARAIDEMIAHIGRAPAAEIVTDRRSIRERRGMRDAQYFAETQDIWIDAVGVYMLGPRLNKLSIELTRI